MNIKVLKDYVELMGIESTWDGLKEYAQLMQDIGEYEDRKIFYFN